MEDKYIDILSTLTEDEFTMLQKANICIVGCGSVGGFALEILARIGVVNLVGIDCSDLETKDLASHSIATKSNIHENKALEAKKRVFNINPDVYFIPLSDRLTDENSIDLLAGNNLIIDATDDIETKTIIQEACKRLELPLISCFLCGWNGFVTSMLPNDYSIESIYKKINSLGHDFAPSTITAPILSSVLVSEAMKMLTDKGELIGNNILCIDMLNFKFSTKIIRKK